MGLCAKRATFVTVKFIDPNFGTYTATPDGNDEMTDAIAPEQRRALP